jgi:tetraacyldisaccharide 4'-kinase
LLKDNYKVATLSRGYGRKTSGFLIANNELTVSDIGDEPSQYFCKFDDIKVTVGEKRAKAVNKIIEQLPNVKVVLLDDAFQHRAIKPGLSILLTDYSRIFTNNFLLPTGTLRECVSSKKRADIIIVTKTPSLLSPLEKRRIESEIKPFAYQKVYFSYIKYGDLTPIKKVEKPMVISNDYYFERKFAVLLLTGIATPAGLQTYLEEKGTKVTMMEFPDHHNFSLKDIEDVKIKFEQIKNPNKIIITTEKDVMRLKSPELFDAVAELHMFYLPIEVAFHNGDTLKFNTQIETFVGKY